MGKPLSLTIYSKELVHLCPPPLCLPPQVGDGEKLVKTMFALARELQPSIIFLGVCVCVESSHCGLSLGEVHTLISSVHITLP